MLKHIMSNCCKQRLIFVIKQEIQKPAMKQEIYKIFDNFLKCRYFVMLYYISLIKV